jgi:hypothetical protein
MYKQALRLALAGFRLYFVIIGVGLILRLAFADSWWWLGVRPYFSRRAFSGGETAVSVRSAVPHVGRKN